MFQNKQIPSHSKTVVSPQCYRSAEMLMLDQHYNDAEKLLISQLAASPCRQPWCDYFGLHTSVSTVFTPAQTNRTEEEN